MMAKEQIDAEVFGAAMGELIREALEPVERRLAALENMGLKFAGVHQRALDYSRGHVVVSGGSSWVALKSNPEGCPGDSPDWALMARAGRDAR